MLFGKTMCVRCLWLARCNSVWAGKQLKKRNQCRYWDFLAKMPRGAWKKFSMLCCLQFLKSTLRHESDVGIHGWHSEKS